MSQTMSIQVSFEGELVRALSWEAARRKVEVSDLVKRLVRNSSRQILTEFRTLHRDVTFLEDRRESRDPAKFREVVRKALGPSGS